MKIRVYLIDMFAIIQTKKTPPSTFYAYFKNYTTPSNKKFFARRFLNHSRNAFIF